MGAVGRRGVWRLLRRRAPAAVQFATLLHANYAVDALSIKLNSKRTKEVTWASAHSEHVESAPLRRGLLILLPSTRYMGHATPKLAALHLPHEPSPLHKGQGLPFFRRQL